MQLQQQASSGIGRFFREAHRRRLFRVALLYIVGAWLVLQVADVLFPAFGIPDTAIQVLLVAAVLGFPVALGFSWIFDIGRHGIRRTPPAGAVEHAQRVKLKRIDYMLLAAFSAVAVLIVYNAVQEVRHAPRVLPVPEIADFEFEPLPKLINSIAVLPFTNISEDAANEYFADGISEEILHRLSAYRELTVIGRTSSFAFKGSEYAAPKLSALLGVSYLLQGSVRKAGGTVRVSAQLLNDSGVQIWSRVFDRELDDIFIIQSEIAGTVAATVAPQVRPPTAADTFPDIAAYEHYLEGRELLHRRRVPEARNSFHRAIEIDAGFAEAYSELAITYLIRAEPGDDEIEQARQAIDTALSLRPGLLRAHAARALLPGLQKPPDFAGSEAELRSVLAQDPTMSDALNWLAIALAAQGREDEQLVVLERAVRIDPLHSSIGYNWAHMVVRRGEKNRAEQTLLRTIEGPMRNSYWPYTLLRKIYMNTGRLVDAHRIVKRQALESPPLVFHFPLGLSYALFADWDEAAYWAARSIKDFPDHPFSPGISSLPFMWRGAHAEAQDILERELKARELRLADMAAPLVHHVGLLRSLAGNFAGAIEALEPVVDADTWKTLLGIEAIHALAWAYLGAGYPDKAEPLLADIDRHLSELEAEGKLQLAMLSARGDDPYLYAMNAALMGQPELALDRLGTAIDRGWRGYYISHHDPRWDALREHPRFQQMMSEVKADVDAQHAKVVQLDAGDDFIARLDTAMAAREESAGAP